MPAKKVTTKKAVAKTAVKNSVVAEKKVAKASSVHSTLSVPVYTLLGKEAGSLALPKEVFGAKVNKQLLSQAMRVYLNNRKTITASTKTRGQVQGSSAKIYAQKGTGRARHGSIRANIFVGGGIVFGHKHRKVIMDLPKKMKKAALISAFSSKATDKKISAISGFDKATGKTKEIASLLKTMNSKMPSTLIITDKRTDNVLQAVKNMKNVTILESTTVNAYEVLKHNILLVTKEAVDSLAKMGKTEEIK